MRLLVAVPLVAVMGFAGLTLVGSVRQVIEAGNAQRLAALATDAGVLAKALQSERAAAAVALITTDAAAVEEFDRQVTQTGTAIMAFERHGVPTAAVESTLRRVATGLANLANVRGQVRYSATATLSSISFSYRILIADLLALREAVATGASASITDDVRAATALAQVGESIGQLQIVVLRSLAMGELTPDAQLGAAAATARLTEASTAFLELARPGWLAQWEQVGANPVVITAQRLRDEVGRTSPGEALRVDGKEWTDSTNAWVTELHSLQRTVDAAVDDAVAAGRRSELRSAAIQGVGVALAIALAAVLTSVVAGRITRRLRWLRNSATAAAYHRLPEVVRELNAAPAGTLRHDEMADRSAADLVIDSEHDDEIAAVGAAVRELFREAVRTAGEQAVMRKNIGDMFVHVSHREQRLVDALLAQVDRVERDETDPERLYQLYQLDNLATRMGRINKSLLVLGGSGASRIRREAVPMVMVVQAALSQIEQYPRVRIGQLDSRMLVAGDVVDELAHMLAELLDNATTYSPPDTEVWVHGQPLRDRLILQVIDQGVGLSSQRREQLNVRLTAPAAAELTSVRSMGLMVVGRLAFRHRLRVELRAGPHGGTMAEVTLPWNIVTWGETITATSGGPGAVGPRVYGNEAVLSGHASIRSTAVVPGPAGAATVNGWFQSRNDGSRAVVVWPTSEPQRWAMAPDHAAPAVDGESGVGLPMRTPQPQDAFASPPRAEGAGGLHRRLDPAMVATAMSAYARAVRDGTHAHHPTRRSEQPS
jgi:signal transduction histidine kinase